MKKVTLLLALTLALVFAFAAVALADQTHQTGPNGVASAADGISSITGTTSDTFIYLPTDGSAIHSGYTNNTDACASCHSVHNAKESSFLLQWASPSEACIACHDGTVTATYDVIGGEIGDTTALTAGGNFAVHNGSTSSASEHGVFGGTLLYTAPGGKGSDDRGANKASGADKYGAWDAEESFTCDSCHEPHGAGGNFRLLNPNPNFVMSQGIDADTYTKNLGFGLKGVQLSTADFTGLNGITKFSFKDAQKPVFTYTDSNADGKYNAGEPVTASSVTDGAGTLITDVTLKNIPFIKDYPVQVWIGATTVDPINYQIATENGNAYVKFTANPGQTGKVKVDYTPILQVKATFTPGTKLTSSESIIYGAGMTEFCVACHTDYQGSRSSSVAVYDTENKYHHSGNRVNSSGSATFPQLGNYNGHTDKEANAKAGVTYSVGSCLTCHFAHGVDQARWKTVATATGINEYDSNELAGSSALKRLPNMGTCEVCHKQQLRSYSPGNKFVQKTIPNDSTKSSWQF